MKNLKAKAVCVMLSASMAAMGLTGCGSDNVDGTKTAITVNDESITLGQANFMLRYQQATMYNYYSKMYSNSDDCKRKTFFMSYVCGS